MMRLLLRLLLTVLPLAACVTTDAQLISLLHTENDTGYIKDLTRALTVRLYGSEKFTNYTLVDRDAQQRLVYKPNNPFNIGIGANYKFIGLNVAFNFPFINQYEKYGRTRFLDAQSHIYFRKLVIDFYGQFYEGYYLSNPWKFMEKDKDFAYFRKDITTKNIGLSAQYIFNNTRFSFRSAYLQNEYQKKSSGSFMAGADVHYIFITADSSLIPYIVNYPGFFDNRHFNKSGMVLSTVNGGYAHTFVYRQHLFLTVGVHAGIGANYSLMEETAVADRESGIGFTYSATVRAACGYNSETYFAGIHYVRIIMNNGSPVPDALQQFTSGNFRIVAAKRFRLRKPLFGKL